MENRTSICKRCGLEFEWIKLKALGNPRSACDDCVPILYKEGQRRYWRSERGKATSREGTAKWASSEQGRAYLSAYEAREDVRERRAAYMQDKRRTNPDYCARQKAWFRAYYATPEGRAKWMATVARRRGIPVENYKAIALAIGKGEAACYSCGCPAKQVDHILPVSMARLLDIKQVVDDYVAPICLPCHVAKNKDDIRDLRRMRRLLA